MTMFTSRQRSILVAMFGLTLILATQAVRAEDEVANPQYAAWSKFKPGSSATLSCDMKIGPKEIPAHMETTTKLVEVTPASLVVEMTSAITVMGKTSDTPATKRTINATGPARDFKETGTADVEAAGKTYKCKVIEITGAAAAANAARPGGRPGAAAAGAGSKVVAYINYDVPGGVVKMVATAGDGKSMTLVLSGSEVK